MGSVKVQHYATIHREPQAVYEFWRNFENLPQFMHHLESVTVQDEKRSHWVAKAPLNQSVTWDAEIIIDQPGQVIAWRSLPDSQIPNRGQIRFKEAPGKRGTEIHVELEYEPPAGKLGALVATLFGEEPHIQIREDVRRFKSLLEAGEIPTIAGQPHGERTIIGKAVAKIEGAKA